MARLRRAAFVLSTIIAGASCAGAAQAAGHGGSATDLRVDGTLVHVILDADDFRAGAPELLEWVRRSAVIVAGYYGAFPASVLDIRISAVDGTGVRSGRASADPLPAIRLRVGREVSREELLKDWVMVHEMTHLALPEVGPTHAWLAEGLATYVEGVARVQAGNMNAHDLWQEDVASMAKGLPQPDDAGLDHTHTWGRTYWGGAIFCLAADVAIRERSENKRGLQDALRAILRQSGGMTASWPIERIFATGDAATGTTVLNELYRSMRDAPTTPELPDLWGRLGLSVEDGVARDGTDAGGARIREAITRRPSPQ